jgi:hypothetical protein
VSKIIRRVRKKAKKKASLSQNVLYHKPGIYNWTVARLDNDLTCIDHAYPATTTSDSKAVISNIINYAQPIDINFEYSWIKPKKLQFTSERLLNYYQQQVTVVDTIDKRLFEDYQVLQQDDIFSFSEQKDYDKPEETLKNRILAGIKYLIPNSYTEKQNVETIRALIDEYDTTQNTDALLRAYYLWDDEKIKHVIYVERCIEKLTQFIKTIITLTSGFKLNLRLWFRNICHFLFKALDDEASDNYLLIADHRVLVSSNQALNKIFKWKRKKLLMS